MAEQGHQRFGRIERGGNLSFCCGEGTICDSSDVSVFYMEDYVAVLHNES